MVPDEQVQKGKVIKLDYPIRRSEKEKLFTELTIARRLKAKDFKSIKAQDIRFDDMLKLISIMTGHTISLIEELDASDMMKCVKIVNSFLPNTDGNRIAVCMRDDTFEIIVIGHEGIQRVNMENGNILPIGGGHTQKYLFDPAGMRADENGCWVKTGTQRCKHAECIPVGDAHVYECSCGQRLTRGFTPKKG